MSGSQRFTLDSNILVYAADARDATRQRAALDIIARAARRNCVLLPQVLGEFFHATTRKKIIARCDAASLVRSWMVVFPIAAGPTATALQTASTEAEATRLQFFDALLLATARDAGCSAVISEDMAAGSELDGVRVVGAFDAGGVSAAARALL